MSQFFKILFVILFSSVKFILVPPLAIIEYKFPVWNAILFTSIGGAIGVLVFYFLSKELLLAWNILKAFLRRYQKRRHHHKHHHNKPVFTKFSRRMVRLKNRWGLYGLAIITPCILSIPIGTFIATQFFPGKRTIFLLCGSVVLWSIILNLGIFLLRTSV